MRIRSLISIAIVLMPGLIHAEVQNTSATVVLTTPAQKAYSKIIANDTRWICTDRICQGYTDGRWQSDVRACRGIAQKFGNVVSFSSGANEMTVQNLAKCNRQAAERENQVAD